MVLQAKNCLDLYKDGISRLLPPVCPISDFSAIVGGGIGGTFVAYSLRQLFGSSTTIDIYELSGKLCGRVAVVEYNKRKYDSGADVLFLDNVYAKSVAENLGKLCKEQGAYS